MAIAADRTEGDIEGVGEDSGESEGRAAGVGDGRVELGSGKRRRYWPGGGRGGIPLEGIASPGVGRTRLEESQRIGRQARITRATPKHFKNPRVWDHPTKEKKFGVSCTERGSNPRVRIHRCLKPTP